MQLDYILDNALSVQTALRLAYGFTDIDVTETTSATARPSRSRSSAQHSGIDFGQISWAGVVDADDADRAPTSPITLSDPNYGHGDASPAASTPRAHGGAPGDLPVDRRHPPSATATPGVFIVTFTGTHAGLDFTQLDGADIVGRRRSRGSCRSRTPRRASTSTVHDGTTTPDRDNVQTIDLSDGAARLVRPPLRPAELAGRSSRTSTPARSVSATARQILSGAERRPQPEQHQPGAAVHRQRRGREARLDVITITFRGAMKNQAIAYSTPPARGHAVVNARPPGIDYYGVDTLNIDLGSGNDVFNVQGTTAVDEPRAPAAATTDLRLVAGATSGRASRRASSAARSPTSSAR